MKDSVCGLLALLSIRFRTPVPDNLLKPSCEGSFTMPKEQWGLCKDCKWWQLDPGATLANTTMGLCIDERLQPFRLRVSGNSGCNRFAEGTPAHAAGSSDTPPTAKPQR